MIGMKRQSAQYAGRTRAVTLCATLMPLLWTLVGCARNSPAPDRSASGAPGARPSEGPALELGPEDLGGVVTGPGGPEAGVWVIAETTDLPTKYAKIVVTDDRGRYLVPGLPPATYDVWVRGYGLIDSPKTRSRPGVTLNL